MKTLKALSLDQTNEIARAFGPLLKKGDIVAFYGNLGVGKTAFIRALIQDICHSNEDVPSPTFTLLQTYDAPDFEIYHFDFYRLEKPHDAYELGIEDTFIDGVNLIEWPEKIGPILPAQKILKIEIECRENERIFHFSSLNKSWIERLNKWNNRS